MKNNRITKIIFALLIIITGETVMAKSTYKVVDGDSLERGSMRIRLIDIDAPELYQTCTDTQGAEYNCGLKAQDALKELISYNTKCEKQGKDKYNRWLMRCYDDTGQDINAQMVAEGWAISYGDKYLAEELVARTTHKGIWRGKFMRPELYRALQKSR